MTQKASQVSAAATRRGDAAARQISCSHQNAQPSLPPPSTGLRCARSKCRAECEVGLRKRELIREALIGRAIPIPNSCTSDALRIGKREAVSRDSDSGTEGGSEVERIMGGEFKKVLRSVRGSLRPRGREGERKRHDKSRVGMHEQTPGTKRTGGRLAPSLYDTGWRYVAGNRAHRLHFHLSNGPGATGWTRTDALLISHFLATKRGAIRMMGNDGTHL